jgi:hypothetical protein
VKTKIYSHLHLIGTADLQVGDESMGCVYGDFLPTEYYFNVIQKSVWNFSSSSRPDYKKWSSFRFNAQIENGYFLFPFGGFTIDDRQDLPDGPKRIDIAGLDSDVIKNYFKESSSGQFVERPWNPVSIEQKIHFEDELIKELGTPDIWTSIFKTKKHALMDFEFSALCNDQRNDDVLFVARKENSVDEFVIVHLTWKGKKEIKNYPKANFYKSLEEFQKTRMRVDKQDFESPY